jgi:hypothetical protein
MSRIPHRLQIASLLRLLLALSFALASVYVASGFVPLAPGSQAPQQRIPAKKDPAAVSTPTAKGNLKKKITNRAVALSADKTFVYVNEPVQFTVTIRSFSGLIYGGCRWSYLLFFGDGDHQLTLLTCARNKKFQHKYRRTGVFVAKVMNITSDCSGVITQPDPVTVTVQERTSPTPTPAVTISPTSSPTKPPSPDPTIIITESPTPTPADQSLSPSPTMSPTQWPRPPADQPSSPKPMETPYMSTSPTARVSPTVSPSASPTPRNEIGVIYSSPDASPSPSPPTTPTAGGWSDFVENWLKLLLVILALLLVASFVGYRVLRPSVRPTLHLHSPDPGTPDFKGGTKNFAINFELLLNPKATGTNSRITTSEASLIRSERKDDG